MKRALITGISGQDGSYLAELLLEKGYEVHGLIRPSTNRKPNIEHLVERVHLHYGHMDDATRLASVVDAAKPDEVYNLASQSQVRISFDLPVYSADVGALGVVRLLEILRKVNPKCRFYQASTSEMFGLAPPPQSEQSPFLPQSPYACAKLFAHHLVRVYREGYGMFACSGIMFNHESPRRGPEFVTRKITTSVANILAGRQNDLVLGDVSCKRDWGYAKEYVQVMWLMLQQEEPGDYVVATGETHSVQDFVEAAFARARLDWRKHLRHDPSLKRPAEPNVLCGDWRKAKEKLGWKPCTPFAELVGLMLEHDLAAAGIR